MSLLTEQVAKAEEVKETSEKKKRFEKIPNCIYNEGVGCDDKVKVCMSCGWQPQVAEMRDMAIRMGDKHFLRYKLRDYDNFIEKAQEEEQVHYAVLQALSEP